MYIIVRLKDGALVSKPGSLCSYTRNIQTAAKFSSIEEAQKNSCGDERAMSIDDYVRG